MIDPRSDTLPADRTGVEGLTPGTQVGRYELIEEIGAGGMGVVWSAHDPELERTVAIKLVRMHRAGDDDYRARLQREAQVMAKLSHPEILPVYDVGRHGDGVFLAMELVKGRTASEWLRTRPPWRAALATMLRAGRGLAAAHDAGIVHRDFKPGNVLLGDDGRVRVGDFGLARVAADALDEVGDGSLEGPALTLTGAVMGTPAYMAPELHDGAQADARSDQFAFAVALHEMVYGARPFAGADTAAIAEAIVKGRVEPAPANARVPRWLRQIVMRGLATDPAARWPSMHAMLDALERTPRRRRRLGFGAASVALVGAGALALALLWPGSAADPCARLPAPDWDPTAAPSAVIAPLGAYRDAIGTMRLASCRATHTTGEQTAATHELRTRCLDRREATARALIATLGAATPADKALDAVDALPPVSDCADVDALAAVMPLPDDPAVRAQIADVQAELDRVEPLYDSGAAQDALALARQEVDPAAATNYPPLAAQARLLAGNLEAQVGDLGKADALLEQAAIDARAGGDATREVAVLLRLARVLGYREQKFDDAARQLALADASLTALRRHADPATLAPLDMQLALQQADLAAQQDHWDEAKADFARAITAAQALGSPYDEARVRTAYGSELAQHGELGPGGDQLEQALAELSSVLGDNPLVVQVVQLLGQVREAQNDFARAGPLLERALAMDTKLYGASSPQTARVLQALGSFSMGQQDFAKGRDYLERALAILDRPGISPTELPELLDDLGSVEMVQGHLDKARADYARELAIVEQAYGPEHHLVAEASYNLARIDMQDKRWADAAAHAARAHEVAAKTLAADSPLRAYAIQAEGRADLMRHHYRDAAAELAEAIAEIQATDNDPDEIAKTRSQLEEARRKM